MQYLKLLHGNFCRIKGQAALWIYNVSFQETEQRLQSMRLGAFQVRLQVTTYAELTPVRPDHQDLQQQVVKKPQAYALPWKG